MTSVDAEMAKCARQDCVCAVPPTKAVTRDGKAYRRDACADGREDHAGCTCRG